MTTTSLDSALRERTWVVAYDFSSAAAAAVNQALEELRLFGVPARLILLHAVQVTPIAVGDFNGAAAANASLLPRLEKEARDDAKGRLTKIVDELKPAAGKVALETAVEPGPAADVIVHFALARHADRIVMGTHGRRGLSRAVLGSVAERVVRTSPIPVLVVRDPARAK